MHFNIIQSLLRHNLILPLQLKMCPILHDLPLSPIPLSCVHGTSREDRIPLFLKCQEGQMHSDLIFKFNQEYGRICGCSAYFPRNFASSTNIWRARKTMQAKPCSLLTRSYAQHADYKPELSFRTANNMILFFVMSVLK